MSTPYPVPKSEVNDLALEMGAALRDKGQWAKALSQKRLNSLLKTGLQQTAQLDLVKKFGVSEISDNLNTTFQDGEIRLSGCLTVDFSGNDTPAYQAKLTIEELVLINDLEVRQKGRGNKLKLRDKPKFQLDLSQVPKKQKFAIEHGLPLAINILVNNPMAILTSGAQAGLNANKLEVKIENFGAWIQDNGTVAILVSGGKK